MDAYQGHVRLYIADERDPLIQTWARIFPGVLKPLSEMSADLRAHLRYPEDIFKNQTAVYSTYQLISRRSSTTKKTNGQSFQWLRSRVTLNRRRWSLITRL